MISRKIKPAGFTWPWHKPVLIKKGADIRRDLLLKSIDLYVKHKETGKGIPGIKLHCEGGRAFDRHAKRLVKDGLLRMDRWEYGRSWDNSNVLSISILVPTEKGFQAAKNLNS